MDKELISLAGVILSLGGAALVKKLSKSKSSIVHKWVAPVVAVGAGVGYTLVTGQDADMGAISDGVGTGSTALFLHTIYKVWRDKRRVTE